MSTDNIHLIVSLRNGNEMNYVIDRKKLIAANMSYSPIDAENALELQPEALVFELIDSPILIVPYTESVTDYIFTRSIDRFRLGHK